MTALIIFIIALAIIVGLFVVKYLEHKRGKIFFLEEQRVMFDRRIFALEGKCRTECTVQNLIAILRKAYNTAAHKFAKITASMAKRIEWRARSVAHKSAKAKQDAEECARENGYLREVQEHKDSLDTAKVAEQTRL